MTLTIFDAKTVALAALPPSHIPQLDLVPCFSLLHTSPGATKMADPKTGEIGAQ